MLLAGLGRRGLHVGLWALGAVLNWCVWGAAYAPRCALQTVFICCPPASPSPPLAQLFTSGFCFLDLLLCMQRVEGAPANIGHTLIVQQAGK